MPYIQVTIGQKLSAPQKERLKSELGRLIAIIPGKSEQGLIVNIQDGSSLYMGGTEEPSAYIDLRVYTKTDGEAKKRITREIFGLITREFAIPTGRQYLTISEYDQWGYGGELHY
jgi:phenylpyruvate tautomerase PptA (4-oxalocrotonate tautomerase family)